MLDDFRNAIAGHIKGLLPHLRECRPHAGRFDLAELKRLAARTPAVYIAILGVPQSENPGSGELDLELAMAAHIVTADTRGLARDVSALNLAQTLISRIYGNRWGVKWAFPAQKVKGQNLYSGNIDRVGVAMWGVSWRQKVRLGESSWADEGSVPAELYASFDPAIGADHEADYTKVHPEE